jgi:predicted nucleic acid-binding protein
MADVLCDTTVLIDALRGRPAAERLRTVHQRGAVLYTSAINVEEVVRGLKPGEETAARRMFNGLRMASLGREEGEMAGTWRREFAARGVTLAQGDCLIAAAAVSLGAHLATANVKDYPMSGIVIENWHT